MLNNRNLIFLLSIILSVSISTTAESQQFAVATPQAHPIRSILWLSDIEHAKELAEQSGRLVYIHFYSDNCNACQNAERYCFQNPEFVQSIHQNFIPVKVNVDQSPSLARKWRVRRWPTDLVIDSHGDKQFESVTDPNALPYMERLKAVYESVAATPLDIDAGFIMEPEQGIDDVAKASYPTHNAGNTYKTQVNSTNSQQNFAPPTVSGAPALPNEMPLGLEGYCPVSLYSPASPDRVWVKGHPQIGIRHRGVVYLFASPQHKQMFLTNPDRYSPVISGFDPVTFANRKQLTPGDRRFGVKFRDRIYLFTNEDSLKTFWQAPEQYALKALEAMYHAR